MEQLPRLPDEIWATIFEWLTHPRRVRDNIAVHARLSLCCTRFRRLVMPLRDYSLEPSLRYRPRKRSATPYVGDYPGDEHEFLDVFSESLPVLRKLYTRTPGRDPCLGWHMGPSRMLGLSDALQRMPRIELFCVVVFSPAIEGQETPRDGLIEVPRGAVARLPTSLRELRFAGREIVLKPAAVGALSRSAAFARLETLSLSCTDFDPRVLSGALSLRSFSLHIRDAYTKDESLDLSAFTALTHLSLSGIALPCRCAPPVGRGPVIYDARLCATKLPDAAAGSLADLRLCLGAPPCPALFEHIRECASLRSLTLEARTAEWTEAWDPTYNSWPIQRVNRLTAATRLRRLDLVFLSMRPEVTLSQEACHRLADALPRGLRRLGLPAPLFHSAFNAKGRIDERHLRAWTAQEGMARVIESVAAKLSLSLRVLAVLLARSELREGGMLLAEASDEATEGPPVTLDEAAANADDFLRTLFARMADRERPLALLPSQK